MKNALKFAIEEPKHIINELKKLEPLYLNLLQGATPDGQQVLPYHKDNTVLMKAILDACTAYRKSIEALNKIDLEVSRYIK